MNATVTTAENLLGHQKHGEPSTFRPVVLLALLILAVSLSAMAWMFFEGSRSLSKVPAAPAAGLVTDYQRWVLKIILASTAAGVTSIMVLFSGYQSRRRTWMERSRSKEEETRKTIASLQCQLADSRLAQQLSEQAQTDAQRRNAALAQTNLLLQAELNQLKKTEKSLSQQRQVLESSKTVLELHVETRTKELQLLQRRYEMILNSAGEGICGLDVEGRTTFANPAVAKITGWPLDELLGKPEAEIFRCNGDRPQPELEGQQFGERIFYRKDGVRLPVEFVKTPIQEDGRVVGAVLVFKDITQRKQVENTLAEKAAELGRSNAELEQFAFVASHDLQEPLRKIQAFGDRLRAKCHGLLGPDALDYLERMQNAATRMRRLIDDLLTFSRAIRSSEPFVPVDLGSVAREVLSDLEVRIEKSKAQVEVGVLPTIEADAMQMRQLLLNLITNALKFQPPGGRPLVRIQARAVPPEPGRDQPFADPQRFELSVQDNGIGFEEKYLDKVFAVFQRLHGLNEYEGTGVGLAVCRRIADRHHGTITARSKPGEGATFIVNLPLRQPAT